MSPRLKGLRQGGMLLFAGAVIVPLLAVLNKFTSLPLDMFVPLAAILFFAGGFVRMLFAAIFEQGARSRRQFPAQSYAPPSIPAQLGAPVRGAALPPASVNQPAWRPRPNTAEIVRPPSVTENTTRLLDEKEKRGVDQ